MTEDDSRPPTLPGNQGQFGEGDATEEFQKLPKDKQPAPTPADEGPKQTGAGERS